MASQGTILLIDDSRTMRALLRKALEEAGYSVFEAETGEKGLEVFASVNPDAILLDVEMPGIDGFETCARLRKLPNGEHIPIIMSTSLDDLVSINKAYDAKATDFITKPINWDLIAHRVRYVIRTHLDYIALQNSKAELVKAQSELEQLNNELAQRVEERTIQLRNTNDELQTTLQSLKDAQDQLITSEKMASLGNLVSGISKEVNVPVSAAIVTINTLNKVLTPVLDDFAKNTLTKTQLANFLNATNETIQLLQNNLQHAVGLVASFRQVSIDKATENRQDFLLKKCLDDTFKNLQPVLKKTLIQIAVDCSEQLMVNSYPNTLSRIINILVINTVNYAFKPDESGEIAIHVTADEKYVNIQYTDSGIGIAEQDMPRIFEPFFSIREGVGHVGLGLHTAYNLVKHVLGGEIKCENDLNKGVKFTIILPVISSSQA